MPSPDHARRSADQRRMATAHGPIVADAVRRHPLLVVPGLYVADDDTLAVARRVRRGGRPSRHRPAHGLRRRGSPSACRGRPCAPRLGRRHLVRRVQQPRRRDPGDLSGRLVRGACERERDPLGGRAHLGWRRRPRDIRASAFRPLACDHDPGARSRSSDHGRDGPEPGPRSRPVCLPRTATPQRLGCPAPRGHGLDRDGPPTGSDCMWSTTGAGPRPR